MKYAQVGYSCDFEGCDADTSPETTWTEARKQAKRDGWYTSNAADYCPEHKP